MGALSLSSAGNFFDGDCAAACSDPSPRGCTRREFVKLVGMTAALAGLSSFCSPHEAYGWASFDCAASFDGIKALGYADPMHEDMTQAAYAIFLGKHRADTSSDSFLNPWKCHEYGDAAQVVQNDQQWSAPSRPPEPQGTTDAATAARAYYLENKKFLRVGSYWNDAAVDNVGFLLAAFMDANNIYSPWNPYANAQDVANHVYETWTEKDKKINARVTLVRFTMNERMNFLHAMLSAQSDKRTYLTQEQVRQYSMTWVENVYKYVISGNKDECDPAIWHLIDTYDQINADTAYNVLDNRFKPKDSTMTEDEPGMPRDAEAGEGRSIRQMRLRALGMLCHTIGDSWCPSHCLRVYCGTDETATGTYRFGDVLAFQNYTLQSSGTSTSFYESNHRLFDAYAQVDVKAKRRSTMRSKTATLERIEALSPTEIADLISSENTLGMLETVQSIEGLFELVYQGAPWEGSSSSVAFSVGPNSYTISCGRQFFEGVVFPCRFAADGSSLAFDAGRRCGWMQVALLPHVKSFGPVFEHVYGTTALYGDVTAYLSDLVASYVADYQVRANFFFSGQSPNPQNPSPSYPQNTTQRHHVAVDLDQTGIGIIESLASAPFDLMNGDGSKRAALIGALSPDQKAAFVTFLKNLRGIRQEFSIDLSGDLLTGGVVEKIDRMLDWAGGIETGSFVASVLSFDLFAGGASCLVQTETAVPETLLLRFGNEVPVENGVLGDVRAGMKGVTFDYRLADSKLDTPWRDYDISRIILSTTKNLRGSTITGRITRLTETRLFLVPDAAIDGLGAVSDASVAFEYTGAGTALEVGAHVIVSYDMPVGSLAGTEVVPQATAVIASDYGALRVAVGAPVLETHGNMVEVQVGTQALDFGDESADVPESIRVYLGQGICNGIPSVGGFLSFAYATPDDAAQLTMQEEDANPNTGYFELVGGYAGSATAPSLYQSNGGGTHVHFAADMSTVVTETCTNEEGACPHCGYQFAGPDPDPDPPRPDPDPKPISGDGSGNKPLAATGDRSGLSSALGLVIGAGAVALGAYSKRRSQIEAEAEQSQQE